MAIDEPARHHLYVTLEQVLGDEDANTLMQHLPPVGWADVTTKPDLDHVDRAMRSDLQRVESSVHARIDQVEATINAKIDQVETSLGARIDQVETSLGARIDQVETSLGARIDQVETSLGARIDRVEARIDVVAAELMADFHRSFGAFRDEIHNDRRSAQRQLIFVLVVAFVSLLVAVART
jgi:hypothetical protein